MIDCAVTIARPPEGQARPRWRYRLAQAACARRCCGAFDFIALNPRAQRPARRWVAAAILRAVDGFDSRWMGQRVSCTCTAMHDMSIEPVTAALNTDRASSPRSNGFRTVHSRAGAFPLRNQKPALVELARLLQPWRPELLAWLCGRYPMSCCVTPCLFALVGLACYSLPYPATASYSGYAHTPYTVPIAVIGGSLLLWLCTYLYTPPIT